MFANLVLPALFELLGEGAQPPTWRNFRIYGVGESALASTLEPLLAGFEGLEIGYCARLGEVDLRLIGEPRPVDEAAKIVRREFPREIVAESEASIEEVVVGLLAEAGETVATAESCTGGLVASTLTDVPGSSAVFPCGYVTYSNAAKTDLLGVPPDLFEEVGAVSEPVARAMAIGCLARSGADHAIAVTGIAGPDGGSEEKPVGTVHVALASRAGGVFHRRYFFPVDRISFKQRVVRLVLDLLRRRLRGIPLEEKKESRSNRV